LLEYGTREFEIWEVDRLTIKKSGNAAEMWVRASKASKCVPDADGVGRSGDCLSEVVKEKTYKQLYSFSCRERIYGVLAAYRYGFDDRLMGGGLAPKIDEKTVVPGSIEEFLWAYACTKSPAKAPKKKPSKSGVM